MFVRLWLKSTCYELFFAEASRLFQVSDIKCFNSKQHFVPNCFPDVVLVLRSKLTCLAFGWWSHKTTRQIWSVSIAVTFCSADRVTILDQVSLRTFVKPKIWPHLRFGPLKRLKNLLSTVTAFHHSFSNSNLKKYCVLRACVRLADRIQWVIKIAIIKHGFNDN